MKLGADQAIKIRVDLKNREIIFGIEGTEMPDKNIDMNTLSELVLLGFRTVATPELDALIKGVK